MRTGNPALSLKSFDVAGRGGEKMTLSGTVDKTALLLVLVLISAAWIWHRSFASGDPAEVIPLMWVGLGGGLAVAMVTIFFKRFSPYTAPVYALLEGLAIGGVSAFCEREFAGVVLQAVALTFGTFICLLLAYKSGWIRASENFKLGVVAATGAIALLYLVDLAFLLFGHPIGFIHEGGIVGILFSAFVVSIAALNLVLDFDFIESGVARGCPKYMEWYGAFGLLVTLIWLYLEILRLLVKLRK